ncbi:DUF1671-domain-containing protein [Plenodomus tracheiphilus IPT5]|uniref:DUF1671-domain-containing protein n=1 Tax=Plenodomus tracheiphilus IPT5 TaxID=1408161 RepID=A0A6A7BGA9_9PLEO|nr:DUF1671-domain-containing protein [Plenodomus tracheiphilus IPT5]
MQNITSANMASRTGLLECPMCDFTVLPSDDYVLQLHFEQAHTTDSPFVVQDDPEPQLPAALSLSPSKRKHVADTPSSDEEEGIVECPEPGCGEAVSLSELNDHLDYHNAESLSFDETAGKYHSHYSSATMHNLAAGRRHHLGPSGSSGVDEARSPQESSGNGRKSKRHTHRERSNTNSSEKSTISRSILTFNPFTKLDKTVKLPNKSARLGKSELGPYAWEERMPGWLHDQLDAGPKISVINRIGRDGRLIKQEQVQNETPGIIPILAQLSALDRTVTEAYYCHPSTLHVGKTPKEGGFCGYRNIQMLLSYIQGAKAQGHEEFPGRTPGILKLQDCIETAWDRGINETGRVQTGGIRDTRKYIGTPEAQAFFLSSEINCAVEQFSDNKERDISAHQKLLPAIERYFARAAVSDSSNVFKTLLPPIYLQQPGHSITIVGFERRRDGTSNLVVFDPMYSTSPAMHKLVGRKNIRTARPEVLYAYRRGTGQLKKHAAFEILILTATPPLFPAWDVLRQFPDCRYVYAFFRSRTLGYDVYPEDYFLRNFPWHQYGGLWVCDEARFARAEPVSALIAQALRRITSDGSSTKSSNITSPTSPFTNMSFQHSSRTDAHMRSNVHHRLPSFAACLDESMNSFVGAVQSLGSVPVFGMGSYQKTLPQPEAIRPTLSLLTDVGRKYPGFPTPLSPTFSAKVLFPSPASEAGSGPSTPRASTPARRTTSTMSVDGYTSYEPSSNCESHKHDPYASQIGLIDNILVKSNNSPQFSPNRWKMRSPPRASSSSSSLSIASPTSPTSPISPSRCISPRTAMLKSMMNKQAFQNIPHNSSLFPDSKFQHTSPLAPSIQIANGTETNTSSPIDPSGTMLLYTSNRSVESGLLGVRPLSETQVAEYRFWRPCGKRVCAFGCGGAHEGEWAAAKRLFKGVEDVDVVASPSKELVRVDSGKFGYDGVNEGATLAGGYGKVESVMQLGRGCGASSWAGRRMVKDWNSFLSGCEREGVARV